MRTIGRTRLRCSAPPCLGVDGKAADDRRFLEALHFFTVENVRWRALPERFGHWNSVWKRFDRLSKAGVFEAFFDTLASMSSTAHLIQMFDSTIVRAHVSAAGEKGGKKARRSAARAAASPRVNAGARLHRFPEQRCINNADENALEHGLASWASGWGHIVFGRVGVVAA